MKFGLFGINTGACARPETAARVAAAAEAADFESVWTGEHVVLPDPQAPPSPVPPGIDLDTAERYRELGVARLTLLAPRREEEILRFIAETQPLVQKLA
jgi:hypothetical protein